MRRKIYSIKEVKEFALTKNGKCLSETYINNKTNLTWKCCECENIFYNCFKNIKYLNNWCPYCSNKFNNNINTIKKLAEDRNGKCLSEVYKNNKSKLLWQCGKCENIWEARLDRVKSGTWCPRCRDSRGEKTISCILNDKKINYKKEYIFKDLKNRRFDFYLPDYNTIIEFDGIQHFQIYRKYTPDIEALKKLQKRDLEKTLYCIKNNIKILRIDYININNIENMIVNSINSKILLSLSCLNRYLYIIDNIGNINFLLFLTEVGE